MKDLTPEECNKNNKYFYERGYKHGITKGFFRGIAVGLAFYVLTNSAISLYNKYNPSLQTHPTTQSEKPLTHTSQLNKSLLKKLD